MKDWTWPNGRCGKDKTVVACGAATQWRPWLWSCWDLWVYPAGEAPGKCVYRQSWHSPMGTVTRSKNPPRWKTRRWCLERPSSDPAILVLRKRRRLCGRNNQQRHPDPRRVSLDQMKDRTRPNGHRGEDKTAEVGRTAQKWLLWIRSWVEIFFYQPISIRTWHGPMGTVFRPNNSPRQNPTGTVATNNLLVACGTANQCPHDSSIDQNIIPAETSE